MILLRFRLLVDRLSPPALATLLWLAVMAVSLFVYRDAITALELRDADDALRLVQVRDLMAGQSWYDVSQYRINPIGGGGLMHWSRFIDAQIAGLIWLLRPLLGPDAAERWAVGLYPPLLILPLFLILARIMSLLGDRRQLVAGLLLAATGVTFLHYFAPLRIDHHNWQLLLSVAMLALALGEANFRRGLLAALVISVHVEISLEGFPYLAIFGALFALDWLRDPCTAPRLAGFIAGLIVIPSPWLLILRGPDALLVVHCDAFSQPYVAGVATAGLVLLGWLRGPAALRTTLVRRVLGLGLAAAAGAGAFLIFGRSCLNGPFGKLEPLVRTYWYDMVREGRPAWDQAAVAPAMLFIAPTLIGLGATLWAWRRAPAGSLADNWLRLSFVALCSGILSMQVFRTSAATHAYLIPGFAVMATLLWDRSRAHASALGRVAAGLTVLAAVPTVDGMIASRATNLLVKPTDQAIGEACPKPNALAPLAAEPPTLLFAPIDNGPTLLVGSRHSVIATGHHRNHVAMNRVISAFLLDPDAAEPIVRASAATYLVLCKTLPEIENLAEGNPKGLAARLARGETVRWLSYDAALSREPFAVYRIKRDER